MLRGPPCKIEEKSAKSNEILRGPPCKIEVHSIESNEMLRGPPCKIEEQSAKSNEILRGPPCKIEVNSIESNEMLRGPPKGSPLQIRKTVPKSPKSLFVCRIRTKPTSFYDFRFIVLYRHNQQVFIISGKYIMTIII